MRESLRTRLAKWVGGGELAERLAAVSVRVDDARGWTRESAAPNDRPWSEVQTLYADALEAWRKNPLAKRIVDITTDYVVGDGIALEAPGAAGRFVHRWWDHPQNRMDLRLPDLVDELTRSGDLFLTLHRNPQDGMSYLRPVPKDRIQRIETAPNDWETELAYHEVQTATVGTRVWLSPAHADAPTQPAVMLHYAINRPAGALLGESDLATLLFWLRRYSRMLEDRVRLNGAVRAFLWMVTVPTGRVAAKLEQYRTPPEAGTVIVKDDGEQWEAVAPLLRAHDASYDLKAVRRMIQGASFPPHWMNEAEDVNRATAAAMNAPALRHLRRRQLYVRHLVVDLAHTAYQRAWEIGTVRARPERGSIRATLPDLSREDNTALAAAAHTLARALAELRAQLQGPAASPALSRLALRLVSKFAGEPLSEEEIGRILEEVSHHEPAD